MKRAAGIIVLIATATGCANAPPYSEEASAYPAAYYGPGYYGGYPWNFAFFIIRIRAKTNLQCPAPGASPPMSSQPGLCSCEQPRMLITTSRPHSSAFMMASQSVIPMPPGADPGTQTQSKTAPGSHTKGSRSVGKGHH